MAQLPVSGTNIRLLSGIPFTNDYAHTRYFDNKQQQENWFLNRETVHTMTQANFQRVDEREYIQVNQPIENLFHADYVMFRNDQYSNKWFYAFIVDIEYRQRNNTRVYIELDVFQTWWFDVGFKDSFIERQHCDLWDSDGQPIVNTVDEGLDYGSEYDTVFVEQWKPYDDLYFMVIVCKEPVHYDSGPNPTLNGMPQPLTYYVHPFYKNGTKPDNVYLTGSPPQTLDDFSMPDEILKAFYENSNAVNNVVSIYITDFIGDDLEYDQSTESVGFPVLNYQIAELSGNDGTTIEQTLYLSSINKYNTRSDNFGNKYQGFKNVTESKLLMYPYCVTILDDYKGNRVEFKNEYISGNDLNMMVKGSMGPYNKVAYHPRDYNFTSAVSDNHRAITSLENALVNDDPQDVPILTSQLSAFLQGNKNQLKNQRETVALKAGFNAFQSLAAGGQGLSWYRPASSMASVSQGIVGAFESYKMGVQQINQMMAKRQDINNVPPSISKLGANAAFSYGNELSGVYITKKQIKDEYIDKLESYFNMFGYKVHDIKLPNFHSRENWNYIKTQNCFITGDINNQLLMEIRSIFDNGITLWHTDDIGNYSLGNGVI